MPVEGRPQAQTSEELIDDCWVAYLSQVDAYQSLVLSLNAALSAVESHSPSLSIEANGAPLTSSQPRALRAIYTWPALNSLWGLSPCRSLPTIYRLHSHSASCTHPPALTLRHERSRRLTASISKRTQSNRSIAVRL